MTSRTLKTAIVLLLGFVLAWQGTFAVSIGATCTQWKVWLLPYRLRFPALLDTRLLRQACQQSCPSCPGSCSLPFLE